MGLWVQFKEALLNLFSAKLRSILAILGILVGTGSVVALITTSQLATQHALAEFKTLGTNLLAVSISEDSGSGKDSGMKSQLTVADVQALKKHITSIESVAPYISSYQTINSRGQQFQGPIIGSASIFAEVAKMELAEGRLVEFFDKTAQFAVIGDGLAKSLAKQGVSNPIGEQIRLGDWYFTVVGVLKPWQPNLFVYLEMDKGVIVPIESVKLVSSYANINNLLVKLKPDTEVKAAQEKIIKELHKILPSAQVNVRNPQEIIDLMAKQQQTYTWLLGAIGGISLLVGGIGVMNIMLVSVIERRREIGIRLAIGAHQSNILWMFLIESVMLTMFGGILGIIIGLSVSYAIARISGWEFFFFILPPALGFVVSVFVGIVSGFYPALRASRLDPIESLHAE